jgi:AraC-like DNA-binding protein
MDLILERSCKNWVTYYPGAEGVELLRASFQREGFSRHRHDTYAIGCTDGGVQTFWYRGMVHSSTPGEVVVLHPDEVHDGYAGTDAGFTYRILYVDPAQIARAVNAVAGRAYGLPFVSNPVIRSKHLRAVIDHAFSHAMEPLQADMIIVALTNGLCAHANVRVKSIRRVDMRALDRARNFLNAATNRLVRSAELEAETQLSRFDLARQFRAHFGTTPYRYSVMRRLERAKESLGSRPIAQVALDAAFSDQAHFSRAFKQTYGLTPRRYIKLRGASRT